MYLDKSRSAASYSHTPRVNDHKWTPVCLLLWNIYSICSSNTLSWPHTHTHRHTHIVAGLGGSCGKRHKPVAALEWAETPPESQLNSSNPSQRKEEYRGIRKQGQTPQYTITVSQWTILSHTQFCSHANEVWCAASLGYARLYSIVLLFFPKEKARQH